MNIPSIESLLAELDKYKRAYESADAQILSLKEQRNRLTDERDEWRKDCHAYADSLRRREEAILKLRTECDGWKKECDIQRNLRIGVEHGFDCANEELGRYKAYVEQLKEEVQRWKYSAENPNFDGRFDTWQAVAGKYRAEVEELTAERDAALAENVAYYQLAKKEVWAVAEAALREAKRVFDYYDCKLEQWSVAEERRLRKDAIATINKVLGEE